MSCPSCGSEMTTAGCANPSCPSYRNIHFVSPPRRGGFIPDNDCAECLRLLREIRDLLKEEGE